MNQQHSYSIVVALNLGIDTFQKPFHFFHRFYWDEFNTIVVGENLNLLAGNDSHGFAHFLGNYHLEFRGNCYELHSEFSIDTSIVIRYVDR